MEHGFALLRVQLFEKIHGGMMIISGSGIGIGDRGSGIRIGDDDATTDSGVGVWGLYSGAIEPDHEATGPLWPVAAWQQLSRWREEVQTTRKLELGIEFRQRSDCDAQVIEVSPPGPAGVSLRDVGRNRNRGATKLCAEFEPLRGRQLLHKGIGRQHQVHPGLPGFQITKALNRSHGFDLLQRPFMATVQIRQHKPRKCLTDSTPGPVSKNESQSSSPRVPDPESPSDPDPRIQSPL